MDQRKTRIPDQPKGGQFYYINRWVDKNTFCAFVYDEKGDQKLAKSYSEFEHLISSGVWFAVKPEASNKERKHKNGTSSSNSK